MAELTFFVGKGGVGKTTLSAAFAVQSASRHPRKRVLLVSTDPAHSLADVLQVKLHGSPAQVAVTSRAPLTAWEMNPAKLFASFMREHKPAILKVIDQGSLFTAQEISPLLDTALPGMAEIAALLAIQDAIASGKYSRIVVDTAPFGHTLRMFSLPQQFCRLLNFLDLAASRDKVLAAHFGGRSSPAAPSFVEQWRLKLEHLEGSFAAAKLVLVTTPEGFALNESMRCLSELRASGSKIELSAIVLNRTIRNPGHCSRCKAGTMASRSAQSLLRKQYESARLYLAEDPGFPILGTRQLRTFAEHVFAGGPLPKKPVLPKEKAESKVQLVRAEWPDLSASLTFVLGKGGVGKTTISAGLGFRARSHSARPVDICSVDPAPSLDDIFQTPVGDRMQPVLGDMKFRAAELDAAALFKTWIAEIRSEIVTEGQVSGVHVDLAFERRLFSELLEIVPPGLDEVLAIFQIMEMRGQSAGAVIIDMAPTGHALELLRMPERILVWARLLLKTLAAHRKLALARNAAVKIAELEVHARQLSRALTSSREVQVFAVMLPELLPDRETQRLFRQLQQLGVAVGTVFVNRVILPGTAGKCRRCQIAVRLQAAILAGQRPHYPKTTFYVLRNFEAGIAGRKGLQSLTRELWRLN